MSHPVDTEGHDDPWAGYTLRTTEDDEDDKVDSDDTWLDRIPGARALAQDASLVDSTSPSIQQTDQPWMDSSILRKDSFYSSFDDAKFIAMQKEYSAKARGMTVPEYEQWEREVKQSAADAVTGLHTYIQTKDGETKSQHITSLQQHLDHQKTVFDTMASTFFNMEEDVIRVQPVLNHFMKRAIQQMVESIQEGIARRKLLHPSTHIPEPTEYHILDVGCGTGSLFQYLLQAAKERKIRLHVTGVDLSSRMIEFAKIHAENILDDFPSGFSFDFEHNDFVQMVMGSGYQRGDYGLTGYNLGEAHPNAMKHKGKYDAVLFNSCFGNFLDAGKLYF
jgi:chemotaxis methyl-accepting protein methylase